MNSLLVYTFRTCAFIEEIERLFGKVFVFGPIKQDLKRFYDLIVEEEPRLILGIARAKNTRFESIAINKFNAGKIKQDGPEKLELFVPPSKLPTASKPTKTFCNYTMYSIKNFIEQNDLKTNLSFIHLNQADLQKLKVLNLP